MTQPAHLWKPAQSGNPGGKPMGLARRVREATNQGQRIIDIFTDILEGRIKSTARDRIEAGRWLADRGFGKVPETFLAGALPEELKETVAQLTADQLLALASGPAFPEERKALPEVVS